jgi:hypothetical protein
MKSSAKSTIGVIPGSEEEYLILQSMQLKKVPTGKIDVEKYKELINEYEKLYEEKYKHNYEDPRELLKLIKNLGFQYTGSELNFSRIKTAFEFAIEQAKVDALLIEEGEIDKNIITEIPGFKKSGLRRLDKQFITDILPKEE